MNTRLTRNNSSYIVKESFKIFSQVLILVACIISTCVHAIEDKLSLAKPASTPTSVSMELLDSDYGTDISNTDQISQDKTADTQPENRLSPFDTLLIRFTDKKDGSDANIAAGKKLFVIDDLGNLVIPHVGSFKISGLTTEETVLRLSAEVAFTDLDIEIIALPVDRDAVDSIKPFGEILFDQKELVFPQLPVPDDYVVGVGDELLIQLYGGVDSSSEVLIVSRDGTIDFPNLGPHTVGGQTLSQVRSSLSQLITERLIGYEISVTLGKLRSIGVLVLGEVGSPGKHLVSSLSGIVDVLSVSGGINEIGSFRNIEVKRRGKKIGKVDLYDLLLTGNDSGQLRLQSGDVVFVPVAGSKIYVTGAVRRPAIYELKNETGLASVLDLAGGTTPAANLANIEIERIDRSGRSVLQASLESNAGKKMSIRAGDRINVSLVTKEANAEEAITIHGHVRRSGTFGWYEGIRFSNLISTFDSFKPQADTQYALIQRRANSERLIQVSSFSPNMALRHAGGHQDPLLYRGDKIYIFSHEINGQRQNLLSPLTEELKQKASRSRPLQLANVEGAVFEPGTYPITNGMRISDLITAAGGLKETMNFSRAELSRITVDEDGSRYSVHQTIDLASILDDESAADLVLQSRDTLTIKNDPHWAERMQIFIGGEVRFPGIYPINKGEQISSVIERAGGLTDSAFPRGAILSRDSIKTRESEELMKLANKIEAELKATILERSDENFRPEESAQVATDVVNLLRSVEPQGRVMIDLPRILRESKDNRISDADITMVNEDTLYIPEISETVTVVGEVNRPGTHYYNDDYSAMDYVQKSGGISVKSSSRLVFVVHADGTAMNGRSKLKSKYIKPGDVIVVPLNVEKIRKLTTWKEVSGVIGNLVNPAASVVNAAAAWKQAEDRGDRIIIQ